MVLLENDAFLVELARFYQRAKSAGSVVITMKRWDGRTKPKPRASKAQNQPEPQHEHKCLIRAALGNKKLSTVVNQKDVNRFQMAYGAVLKVNMDGLKKKKKSKSKATQ